MKTKNSLAIFTVIILVSGLISNPLQAQDMNHHHANHTESGHEVKHVSSPAGVMGDHIHTKGKWMFSYMYMGMKMADLYEGTSQINPESITGRYNMTSEEMFMQMHMVGAMYAFSDRLTVMTMLPLVQKEMSHAHMGHHGVMNSSGLGDIKLSLIFPLYRNQKHQFMMNTGLTLPTGSVKVSSSDGMGMETRMGYGMQLGSGTSDFHGLMSYSSNSGNWGYGTQIGGIIRLGENSENYRQGNSIEHSAWAGRKILSSLSAGLRIHSSWLDHIQGYDHNIDPAMIPAADPHCQGGLRSRLMGSFTLDLRNLLPLNGSLGIEAGKPIYQNLNGPQMGESWTILTALKISI